MSDLAVGEGAAARGELKNYNNKNRIGIYAAERLTSNLSGVIFREQRVGDTGLNAHLELIEEYPRMGKMTGLQIRLDTDENIEKTSRGYVCKGEMPHVAYWLQHALSVLVMVYEQKNDRLLWNVITAETIDINNNNWNLLVPYDEGHVYSTETIDIIADLPCYSPYLARLALARPWMQLIESGRDIIIEMDEWINQPSSMGALKLSVFNNNKKLEAVYDWPFYTASDMPHAFRLASLFPWANIENEHNNLKLISPYAVEAGEIARFRLKLTLNDLGKAFLITEKFLRKGEFPKVGQINGFGAEYEDGIKFKLYRNKNKIKK